MFAATHPARDWVDWVLAGLSLAGVAIAVWQSIRSGRLATAARNAIERAERQLTSNQLITLAPQLTSMELELEQLAAADRRDETSALLIRWRQTAYEVVGMVEARPKHDPDLVTAFRTVATAATQAQGALSDQRTNCRVQTKQVRQDIAEALGHLSRYAGSLKSTVDGGSNAR